jgi:hypothetical protein
MTRTCVRGGLWLASGFLLVCAACRTSKPVERPVPGTAPAGDIRVPTPPPAYELYAADEALRDVLSGELTYLGTGRWPGIERSFACAFRNQRVLVVNVYCTLTESHAFRIDVYSPERGRIRIYAEASGPVSARNRADYFTFMAESGFPPGPELRIPAVALTMSYEDLRSHEQQRYDAFLPGCFGGEQHQRSVGGCLGSLAARESDWTARNRSFLAYANDDWYRVIRQMRALAERHGRAPD